MQAPLTTDRALNELRFRFLIRCRDRVAQMKLEMCNASPSVEAPVLAEIRRLAHQMAGSGGVFGAPEITDSAARLERACSNPCVSRSSVVSLLKHLDQLTGVSNGLPAK